MGHSSTFALAAHSDGLPLVGKTKEFTAPIPERETADVTAGRIVQSYRTKGFKVGDWSFVQEGMTQSQAEKLGIAIGESYPLTFKETVEEGDGKMVKYEHLITGHITKASKAKTESGEENNWTVEGKTTTYQLRIDGKLVHNINIETQRFVMFGDDLTSKYIDGVR